VDFNRLSALLHRYCPEPGDRPILIVEDDEISSHLLRRNLEREGFTALVAPDGKAALDLIQLHLPALILLDLMMPEMDGFEFAQKLRARKGLADVPVVVLTAKELTEEERLLLRGNVTTILQKQTLTEETLHSELRIALARHFRQRTPE
jgi:CheY-like chemotaxis protein